MRRLIPALALALALTAPLAPAMADDFDDEPILLQDLPEPMRQRLLERERRVLERIREADEEQHRALMEMRDAAERDVAMRREYLAALERSAREVRRAEGDPAFLERRQQMDSRRHELEELTRGYTDLSQKDQKARRSEMERVAAELFEMRQEQRRARVAEMEQRIEEMKAAIDERDAAKDEIIRRHLDQLIYGPPDL